MAPLIRQVFHNGTLDGGILGWRAVLVSHGFVFRKLRKAFGKCRKLFSFVCRAYGGAILFPVAVIPFII